MNRDVSRRQNQINIHVDPRASTQHPQARNKSDVFVTLKQGSDKMSVRSDLYARREKIENSHRLTIMASNEVQRVTGPQKKRIDS